MKKPLPSSDAEAFDGAGAVQTRPLAEEQQRTRLQVQSEGRQPFATARVIPSQHKKNIPNFVEIKIYEVNLGAVENEVLGENSTRCLEKQRSPRVNRCVAFSKFFCPHCRYSTKRKRLCRRHLRRHEDQPPQEVVYVKTENEVHSAALDNVKAAPAAEFSARPPFKPEARDIASPGLSDEDSAMFVEIEITDEIFTRSKNTFTVDEKVESEKEELGEKPSDGLVNSDFVDVQVKSEKKEVGVYACEGLVNFDPVDVQIKAENEERGDASEGMNDIDPADVQIKTEKGLTEIASSGVVEVDPAKFLQVEFYSEPEVQPPNSFSPSQSAVNRQKNVKRCYAISSQTFQFVCRTCLFGTNAKGEYLRHLVTHKVAEQRMTCMVCNFTTISQRRFQKHVATHEQAKTHRKTSFTCSICQYKTDRRSVFCEHLITHDNEQDRPIKCPECPYRTHRKDYLKTHTMTHNVGETKKFTCWYCSYETNYNSHLQYHLNSYHFETKHPFVCATCGYKSHRKAAYSRHLLTHDPNRPKPYGCPHCSYKTDRRPTLMTHIKTHASSKTQDAKKTVNFQKVRNFCCPICPYETQEVIQYSNHRIAHVVHQGV